MLGVKLLMVLQGCTYNHRTQQGTVCSVGGASRSIFGHIWGNIYLLETSYDWNGNQIRNQRKNSDKVIISIKYESYNMNKHDYFIQTWNMIRGGSFFAPEKCLKEFIPTWWACFENPILAHSIFFSKIMITCSNSILLHF